MNSPRVKLPRGRRSQAIQAASLSQLSQTIFLILHKHLIIINGNITRVQSSRNWSCGSRQEQPHHSVRPKLVQRESGFHLGSSLYGKDLSDQEQKD